MAPAKTPRRSRRALGSLRCALLLCCLLPLPAPATDALLRTYAAASLTDVLGDIAAQWTAGGHPRPQLVLASSSTLARQIEAGAPADVFASADTAWMDQVQRAGRVADGRRLDLLGNTLVLVAPKGRVPAVTMAPGFNLAAAFDGRLCTGEPGVVPVGRYAQAALQSLGWWTSLQGRIVGTDDVRTALAFVERGECALGIVYATDAATSARVEVVARFPADTHPPIVYPFALLRGASPAGRDWFRYLQSEAARRVFERHGFVWLPARH